MKAADYVIVAVILIWFCAALRIIIKNRGGCGCEAGTGGCSMCRADGKGCSGCGACEKCGGGKECSVCGFQGSKDEKKKSSDIGKGSGREEKYSGCGKSDMDEGGKIHSGDSTKEAR